MADSKAAKVVKHWMKKAFKPSHKGRLHRLTGTPLGQKIPEAKMRAALAGKYGKAGIKEAQLAHNANK